MLNKISAMGYVSLALNLNAMPLVKLNFYRVLPENI